MRSSEAVKQISECFIKPKHEIQDTNNIIPLTPWDLAFLSLHYNQKGLLFAKPQNQKHFSIHKLLDSLKDSLSLTLVHFYPLAGQLAIAVDEDRHQCSVFIDCRKGPGVGFVHASLDMTMSDILSPADVPLVVKSLFDHSDWRITNYDGHHRPLLCIQVTEMIDGVFIGCSMNHVVADGSSLWRFWNVWSHIHRANGRPVVVDRPPVHARWFPDGCGPPVTLPYTNPHEFLRRYEPPAELTDRVFHISSESMASLKAKANKDATTDKISSFQALSALLWRSIARARGLGPDQLTHCMIAANNRQRLDPPLSSEYFGNSVQSIRTTLTVGELLGQSLGRVAWLLHLSVANHTDRAVRGYVKEWVESPVIVDVNKVLASNSVKMGSSPRFDMYGNEFVGLGKPVAFRSGFGNRYAGKVNVHPGRKGGGSVDLEISLMPDSVAALESDHEFMAVVCLPDRHILIS